MASKLAVAAAALVVAAAAWFAVTAVSAHSRPVRFDPAPGSVLTSAPQTVRGWFNAELRRDENWTFLHVTDAQGNRVDTGETQLSADRLQLTAMLKSGLGNGKYTVTWRTFDDVDGAIFGDCYVFFVGQAAADEAVAAKSRLDGDRECQRIDVSARDGTPVAGGTPQATAVPDGHQGDQGGGTGEVTEPADGDGGVPVWSLVLGVIAGLVAGGAGIHLVEKRG